MGSARRRALIACLEAIDGRSARLAKDHSLTPAMSSEPRYASLRDYLGLLRRQRLIIVAATVVLALAGLAVSLAQSKTYTAEADVSFRDISQDLRLLQPNAPASQTPGSLALKSAQTVTSQENAKRVQHELRPKHVTVDQLQSAVTTRVATLTGLVVVQASWDEPKLAARIANGFAEAAVNSAEREQREQIDHAIASLKDRLPAKSSDLPPTPVETTVRQAILGLQTVRSIAHPAEIEQRAQPPTTPSSPKPVRNAALGGIVGLALGLLAAFMRDSLDRRIRGSKDVHEELGYPVLGRIGTSALKSAGLASDGRVPLTPEDLESFRVLRTNLAFFDPERPLRSVLVTSGLPEEGKTTVATSLASAAAAAGQRVLLVDADLRQPAIASRIGVNDSPGLAEYLVGASTPQEILQTHLIRLGPDAPAREEERDTSVAQGTLICIAAGRTPAAPADLLASQRCQDFLEKVARTYDLVVIDSSPLLSSVDPLELVPYVEGVIVCVRLSRSTRDEARAIRTALGRLPKRLTGVVITGFRERESAYGYYGDADES
jgi:succinoglycan biosynthesis transport protein ExoP